MPYGDSPLISFLQHSRDFREPSDGLCLSKCGPRTSSICIMWQLSETQSLGPVPDPADQGLCGGPRNLGMLKFEKHGPRVLSIHPQLTGIYWEGYFPAWEGRKSQGRDKGGNHHLSAVASLSTDPFLQGTQGPTALSLRKSASVGEIPLHPPCAGTEEPKRSESKF